MMRKRTAHDYKFLKLLGEGSFSSVYLAVDSNVSRNQIELLDNPKLDDIKTKEIVESNLKGCDAANSYTEKSTNKVRKYAIKVCQKSYIKRQGKQAAIMREKDIMNILNQHPNQHFIKLHCTFQDTDRLYFVMTYAENGELLTYMQERPLSLYSVHKYTLQLVSALEHLHKLGIVHRDLKPENILLNDKLNILITDFGSAQIYTNTGKDLKNSPERRNSFVGTAQYVSPEMLKSRHATNMSDLWALGVIVFQMVTNVMPFNGPNEYLIYQKIQNLDYEYPDDFDPSARDLVSSLIKLEPTERLGAMDDLQKDGYQSIRRHSFICTDQDSIIRDSSLDVENTKLEDPDLVNVDRVKPGLDEAQLLRLLTLG